MVGIPHYYGDESEIHEVERGCAAGLCLHHYQSKIVTGAAKMRDPGVVASLYAKKKKKTNESLAT